MYIKKWGPTGTPTADDMHFYSYDCDCEDPQSYPSARFISEFGFQSLPSFSTIKTVSKERDWRKDSEFMKYRQRHEGGDE
mmetsp:Transcript_3518/g.3668  ORF Transcript_3518/g.3668 Transcript_3518/m.3668 type:complete len:80 (+) Transcript_3518:391-630(+)